MKNSTSKNPSIREIARLSGASPATVSRVLRGKGSGSAMSHSIFQAAESCGYFERNAGKRSALIICLNGYDAENSDCAFMLERHLASSAPGFGFELKSVYCAESELGPLLAKHPADGLIIIGEEDWTTPRNYSLPTVVTKAYTIDANVSSVNFDEVIGSVKMLQYLKGLGHRRIGFFADRAIAATDYSKPRRFMLPQIYALAGLEYAPELIFAEDFPRYRHTSTVVSAVRHFLDAGVTAIFMIDDCYAPAFYEEIRARGLNIPNDISVVGYDDSRLSMLISPHLTTVNHPYEQMANETFHILKERIANPTLPRVRVMVEPEVIIRDSAAPPKK